MLSAIRDARLGNAGRREPAKPRRWATGMSILMVDHEDSFVHTLANYFRQTGAKVTTVRVAGGGRGASTGSRRILWCCRRDREARRISIALRRSRSSGPASCRCSASASACRRLPRAMAAACASWQCLCMASRRASGYPSNGVIFSGLPKEVTVGRYHSIFADYATLPRGIPCHSRDR
jgi:anthranilate synthase